MNTYPYTDEEVLERIQISSIPRNEIAFDMTTIIQKHKDQLDSYHPMNDWLLIIEDMSLRNSGRIIPVKNRYYQFKGMVYAKGEKVQSQSLTPGVYVLWGLYNGKYVPISNELNTWFVREIHILGITQAEAKLSE
jgi:hypothetical protein